jgi:4'-phosphopantetheinyl transferase
MRPSSKLQLSENDVHVWRLKLDSDQYEISELIKMLSLEEKRAAGRFHFEKHRRRYIGSHAGLRTILGRFYTDIRPEELRFGYGEYGKPHILAGFFEGKLCFNMAASHELALIAVTRDNEIGVDVEFCRDLQDTDEIAAHHFTNSEIAAYQSLKGKRKIAGFYHCWTRKEAFIKAIGEGMSYPLDRFEVSLVPEEPARLISIEGDTEKAQRWTLKSFYPSKGYTAALAVKKSGLKVSYWQLPEMDSFYDFN